MAAALVFSGALACGMTSYAATVEEVIEAAKNNGIPETMIQQGLNEYYNNPEKYADNDYYLDNALYAIENYRDLVIESFEDYSGTTGTTEPPVQSETSQPETESSSGESEGTASAPVQDSSEAPSAGTTSQGSASSDNGTGSQQGNSQSGSSSSGASQKEFIDMTLEEKQEYAASLSETERQEFLSSLSAEELKSIVKQLPVDDKAAIVEKFVEVGEAMGVEVTVEEINDENVSMIMKNEDGELIDIANVGVIVEDTGYNYGLIYSLCGACIILAAGGIYLVIRKCFGSDGAEEKYGRK